MIRLMTFLENMVRVDGDVVDKLKQDRGECPEVLITQRHGFLFSQFQGTGSQQRELGQSSSCLSMHSTALELFGKYRI